MNNEMAWTLKRLAHINLSPVLLKIVVCDEISLHCFGYLNKMLLFQCSLCCRTILIFFFLLNYFQRNK